MALENGGPTISLQILHYPPLDIVTPPSDKPSPLGSKAVLQPWLCEVFDTAYTPDLARRRHRFVSPAWKGNADGIAGIAPALVISAEFDRLRDEAKRYADKLEAVGSLVEYVEVSGVDHGYDIMTDVNETTLRMYEVISAHVSRAVG
jgi:acetyl esterase